MSNPEDLISQARKPTGYVVNTLFDMLQNSFSQWKIIKAGDNQEFVKRIFFFHN